MVYIITSIELLGGIIFGSLPALKPLLAKILPPVFGSSYRNDADMITITKTESISVNEIS